MDMPPRRHTPTAEPLHRLDLPFLIKPLTLHLMAGIQAIRRNALNRTRASGLLCRIRSSSKGPQTIV